MRSIYYRVVTIDSKEDLDRQANEVFGMDHCVDYVYPRAYPEVVLINTKSVKDYYPGVHYLSSTQMARLLQADRSEHTELTIKHFTSYF